LVDGMVRVVGTRAVKRHCQDEAGFLPSVASEIL